MTNSFATDTLNEIIDSEKENLKYQKTDFGKKKVQEKILKLQNVILPIVETETVLLYNEIVKYVHKYIKKAVELNKDAVLIFLPLKDISEKCDVGVVNPKLQKFGSDNIDAIEISIENMDVGGRKIKVSNLDLNDLM